ncbi:hypothetical protein E2C01_079278 [Portunus trituberculatus]|uniref:Uncharacterized protein n=1 Tax=Portunus trituberculatus TaxID=210409 RepID=A0A5B7IV59_PORTR|nr:hypothetical protein [Portunus trituberculatus]
MVAGSEQGGREDEGLCEGAGDHGERGKRYSQEGIGMTCMGKGELPGWRRAAGRKAITPPDWLVRLPTRGSVRDSLPYAGWRPVLSLPIVPAAAPIVPSRRLTAVPAAVVD